MFNPYTTKTWLGLALLPVGSWPHSAAGCKTPAGLYLPIQYVRQWPSVPYTGQPAITCASRVKRSDHKPPTIHHAALAVLNVNGSANKRLWGTTGADTAWLVSQWSEVLDRREYWPLHYRGSTSGLWTRSLASYCTRRTIPAPTALALLLPLSPLVSLIYIPATCTQPAANITLPTDTPSWPSLESDLRFLRTSAAEPEVDFLKSFFYCKLIDKTSCPIKWQALGLPLPAGGHTQKTMSPRRI